MAPASAARADAHGGAVPAADRSSDASLLRQWASLFPAAQTATEADAVTRTGRALLARWGEPAGMRFYHTRDHLAAVLQSVSALEAFAADPRAVKLAAWYHDAVYDPRSSTNEEDSALLAESHLPALGVPPATVAAVGRLVRLTATHAVADSDTDGAVLCDADLAVLCSSREEYAAYAENVRREYAHVGELAFRLGRARVLQALLARPRLYHTPRLAGLTDSRTPDSSPRFPVDEGAGRDNLAQELCRLGPVAQLVTRAAAAVGAVGRACGVQ